MKIAFLCGSLEPGRDGVGDYVRQLALELRRQGQQTVAIALKDQYITEVVVLPLLLIKEALPVLRLPAKWPAFRRFRQAHQWLEEFQPSWISIQFVPYSFHQKGLPVTLGEKIIRLAHNRQIHLMMHECWIGNEPGTTLKRQLISCLQKKLINRLISYIHPSVIHTHLPVYQASLQRLGWHALPLPLFSNIPVSQNPLLETETSQRIFRIGIFSQISFNSPFITFLIAFITQLIQYPHSYQIEILLIGGEPAKMSVIKSELEIILNLRGQVRYTGFIEPIKLSDALQGCQLGITTVPRNGLGKSGSVAAFLAHGIPVAAPYIHPEAISTDIGFFSANLRSAILTEPDIASYQNTKIAAQKAKNIITLSKIARTFLIDISNK
ncbi:glycosyltransferase family 4 protein [Hymenobacter sp. RP-2-7]|uniref:Glycosyltransferase family 4 protein n=1 Tax=Hymenobacter polaris TaxID=2682546 RepID=A0A7Y0AA93_9BACT|nr:hypothetical protein [Hymenobacter polaris]NML63649.1 glycosyltransferase family 4 protein [Hymenobacter polaris]